VVATGVDTWAAKGNNDPIPAPKLANAPGGAQLSNDKPKAAGTAAAGTGTEASRDDHVHPGQDTPLSDDKPKPPGTAAAGTGTEASREDHVHPRPAGIAVDELSSAASGRLLPTLPSAGSRNNKIPKFDGDTLGWEEDAAGSDTPLSDDSPKPPASAAAAGTSAKASRGDHAHPRQTDISTAELSGFARGKLLPDLPSAGSRNNKIPKFDGDTLGWEEDAAGSSTPLSDATPKGPGTAAAGTGAKASRGDHVHPRQTAITEAELAAAASAKLLPALPDAGSRDNKIPKFNGDTLGWEVDAGGGGGGVSLSDATPEGPGTAAAGTGTKASRDDHVHPRQSAITTAEIGDHQITVAKLPSGAAAGKYLDGGGAWKTIPSGGGGGGTAVPLTATSFASQGLSTTVRNVVALDDVPDVFLAVVSATLSSVIYETTEIVLKSDLVAGHQIGIDTGTRNNRYVSLTSTTSQLQATVSSGSATLDLYSLTASGGDGTEVAAHTPAAGDTLLSGLDIAGTDYEIADAHVRREVAALELEDARTGWRISDVQRIGTAQSNQYHTVYDSRFARVAYAASATEVAWDVDTASWHTGQVDRPQGGWPDESTRSASPIRFLVEVPDGAPAVSLRISATAHYSLDATPLTTSGANPQVKNGRPGYIYYSTGTTTFGTATDPHFRLVALGSASGGHTIFNGLVPKRSVGEALFEADPFTAANKGKLWAINNAGDHVTLVDAPSGGGTTVAPHSPGPDDKKLYGLDIAGTDYEIADGAARQDAALNTGLLQDMTISQDPGDTVWANVDSDGSEGSIAHVTARSGQRRISVSTAAALTYTAPATTGGSVTALNPVIRLAAGLPPSRYRFQTASGNFLVSQIQLVGTDGTYDYYFAPDHGFVGEAKLQITSTGHHVGNTRFGGDVSAEGLLAAASEASAEQIEAIHAQLETFTGAEILHLYREAVTAAWKTTNIKLSTSAASGLISDPKVARFAYLTNATEPTSWDASTATWHTGSINRPNGGWPYENARSANPVWFLLEIAEDLPVSKFSLRSSRPYTIPLHPIENTEVVAHARLGYKYYASRSNVFGLATDGTVGVYATPGGDHLTEFTGILPQETVVEGLFNEPAHTNVMVAANRNKVVALNNDASNFELVDASSGGGGASLSDTNPQGPGTAAAGSGTKASRDDHVHPRQSAITTAELGGFVVTSAKIAGSAVTNAKIAQNAINTAVIADDAVTDAKLADNAVHGSIIKALGIGGGKFSAGAITNHDIANATISQAKLDAALQTKLDDLGTGTVEYSELGSFAVQGGAAATTLSVSDLPDWVAVNITYTLSGSNTGQTGFRIISKDDIESGFNLQVQGSGGGYIRLTEAGGVVVRQAFSIGFSNTRITFAEAVARGKQGAKGDPGVDATKWESITQAAYDALTTKDVDRVYFIVS